MKDLLLLKISEVITTSKTHQKRLNDSYGIIKSWGKELDKDTYYALTLEQIAITDQYVYRFAKLQDLMGEKLFKLTLEYVGENIERLSFIEILNKLEKLGIIKSAEVWLKLIEGRNKITHDYAKFIDEVLEDLTDLLSKKDLLIFYFEDILAYLSKRGLEINTIA